MEFRLLGPVEVLHDGRALGLGGRRQRVVLAHLLLAGGTPVTSDALVEQVWGDDAPAAVRASLHTYVSRLRSALGPERLEKRASGYVLRADPVEVDTTRFEQHLVTARADAAEDPQASAACYEQALALVRGPALGDLADEPSLRAAARHWDGLVGAARRERIAVALRLGRPSALVPELEDLLRIDPLGEDLWEQYVLALYRCGRQADALGALARARTTLRDELGIEPSQRLRTLHAQVLRQDPALTVAGSALRGYRLLGVLGEGSSAVVHRAVQPYTGRDVALKSLHPWLADDPDVVRAFAAEAQRALQLEHPYVVPLHDYWREPGGAMLAMRLMRGGDLAHRLERAPMAVSTVVRLVEQVTGALAALAGPDRSEEPIGLEDVLLDEHDNAYLSCFCLARQLAPSSVGSPAPGAVHVDPAATGRLLHEVLARQPSAPRAVVAVAEQAVAGGFDDADELCAALRHAVTPTLPVQRTSPGPTRARNPYKGLRAFGVADAGDFFGRTGLVEHLLARLAGPASHGGRRFLAVVGPSGSGKSSLVLAGLVPALRRRPVAGARAWAVATMVPGLDPFAELVRALQDVAVRPLPADLTARLRQGADLIGEQVDLLAVDADDLLLLVIDQFEELFTLAGDADRRAFAAALAGAVDAPDSRVRVVVTLRADFYDRPLTEPALAELLRLGTEVVVPLDAEGLEQAVVEPAAGVGLRVETALLAQVAADVGGAPTCLPLLQYALTELVEHRRTDRLTLADYRELGGVRGALVRRADATWSALPPEQQAVARRVLLQLVQPDASGVFIRRRVLQSELEARTGDPPTTRSVLQALGGARLLTFDRDPATRAPTVEVAHEALLGEWGLLRDWVDVAREDLATEYRLRATAREWDDSGRDPSFLASGSRFEALERWSVRWRQSQGGTTPLERDYLAASLRDRDRVQRDEQLRRRHELLLERSSVRRLRVAASVLAVAVAGMTALAAFGASQRDRAERESVLAQSRALAAGSAASLVDDPERGVLLALEALRMTRNAEAPVLPEAEEALHSAVVASRVQLTLPGIGGALEWSSQGQLVTEGPEDSGLVEIRDGADGSVLRSYPGHGVDVDDVAFSPDGTRLLTTGEDGAARLWDPSTGRLVWELVTTGQVWAPTFSGDGTRMAASWADEGVIRVVDVATGALVAEVRSVPRPFTTALTHHGDGIAVVGDVDGTAHVLDVATGALVRVVDPGGRTAREVDISPDGQWLVTAGADARARIWSVADGSLQSTVFGSAQIGDVDWSGDGSRLVAGGDDGIARVFDVEDPTAAREVFRLSSNELRGVLGVAFAPDGSTVALGDSNGRATQIYDVGLEGSSEWLTATVPDDLVGADFTADGEQIVVSAPGGGVAFRDASGGGAVRATGVARGNVAEIRTSPDGALVAGAVENAVVVWDVASGAERFAVSSPGLPWELAWSTDGSLLAWSDDDIALRVVDRDGRAVAVPGPDGTDDGVASVAFTPDGTRAVAAHRLASRNAPGTGHVQVVDWTSGQVVERWDLDVDRIDVSPDGRVVAQATRGGDVVLHDLDTGRQSHALVGHVGHVWDLDFSSDGRLLATSGEDATVRLWDVRTGTQRVALRGHRSVVHTGQFSPDGRRLVTTSGDGTVRVWAVDLDDLVQIAHDRVTRGLTDEECRRYLQRRCG